MDSQDSVFRWAVDAGAFYTGLVFQSSASRYCTTETVFDEVKHIKKSQGAIEVLLESNSLQIINPDKKSIEKVFSAARRTGDYPRLSEADISIIALALQLEVPLITDDYAVANVAATMKIPVKSLATRGITHTRKWITYCSACGRTFGATAKECRLCGNTLRRKYKLIWAHCVLSLLGSYRPLQSPKCNEDTIRFVCYLYAAFELSLFVLIVK